MRLNSPTFKSINQLRRLLSTTAKPKATSKTYPTVGEAPFPLRLVYTYRSPAVQLRRNAENSKQTSPWIPLGFLLGTNFSVFAAWNALPPNQDAEALMMADSTYQGILNWEPEHTASADAHADFMKRHFTASVENLVSGRLHTLITAGISQSDFWHFGGNMFALVLFGYRSCLALGPLPFIGLYVAGSFAASSAHIMHNLYVGKTTPSLTSAELRCALRNTLREIEDEMRPRMSWGLPFMGSRRTLMAIPSVSSSFSVQSMGINEQKLGMEKKNGGGRDDKDDDELTYAERIGRLMAEVGVGAVALVRNYESADDQKETIDTQNGDGGLQRTDSEEDMNRRLQELRRETDKDGSDLREIFPKKTRLQRIAEERNRKKDAEAQQEEQRQAAVLEVAGTLVRHRYGSVTDTPSLGASGAVMAITNGSVLLFPLDRVVRAGVNLSLPISAAIYTISDLAGFVYPDATDPVDHTGHLAGAGTGLLYVWLRWTALARAGVGCPGVHGSLPIITQWLKSGIRL